MKQCITVEVAGKTCHLIYNNQAMFDLQELFPDRKDFQEAIAGDTREHYEATIKVFLLMAEQGELVRGYYGYPAEKVPSEEHLRKTADQGDWIKMKNAIYSAVVLGIQHHVDPIEEIDVDLLEFQNEKNGKSP